MKISSEKLADHLNKGLGALYTVYGAEPLLILEAVDRLRVEARKVGYTEREVLIAETGFRWNELGMNAASQSLFGERKILEIRIPNGKPGIEGSKAIEAFTQALPHDTLSLFILPEVERASQSSKWFQALESKGVMIEAQPISRDRLPDWIGQRLAQQQQKTSRHLLQFIADQVEGNLLAAYQEIQKLALIFPPGELTFEQIQHAVSDVSRYDVYSLGDAILEGDVQRVTRMMDGLQGEGEAPPLVLWAVSSEIRGLLAVARTLQDRKPITPQMQREYRLWGPRQGKVERAAKRLDISLLENALMQCQEVDRMIKGLTPGDVWDALLQLTLAAAGKNVLPLSPALSK